MIRRAEKLKKQCEKCKLGNKRIGPKSGCDIRKVLVIRPYSAAWDQSELFLNPDGSCKRIEYKE